MAILSISNDLLPVIPATWKQDPNINWLIQDLQENPHSHDYFCWDGKLLKWKGKIIVGYNEQLREQLNGLYHETIVGGHSGTQVNLEGNGETREYVRCCGLCQQNKLDLSTSLGLLQPLPIPEGVFTEVIMDFITGLPKANGKEVITVVVDCLTNMLIL